MNSINLSILSTILSISFIYAWKMNIKSNTYLSTIPSTISSTDQPFSIQRTSAMIGKLIACSSLLFSDVCLHPNPVYAQGSSISFNGGSASKLFAQAEDAIESTQKSYKALEKEWADAKKALMDINKDLQFTKQELTAVESDLIKLEVKALQIFEVNKLGIAGMKGEVAKLRQSTAEKYQAAEEASLAAEKPSSIAKLFESAQNEALLLAENEKVLKSFEEIEESLSVALRKSGDTVRGMQDSIKQLKLAEKEQLDGYDILTEGIAISSKKFDGSKTFKNGIIKILRAQGKDTGVLRGLAKDIRNVQLESEELSKIFNRILGIQTDSTAFETNTKLNLKQAKAYVKTLAEKAEIAAKASKVSLDKILETSNAVSATQFRKGSKVSKREDVANLLHAASNRLEFAEKSGKNADSLLKEARKQGEKEASIYLKYFQYSKEATNSNINNNNALKSTPASKPIEKPIKKVDLKKAW